MLILEDLGISFLNCEAHNIFKHAECKIERNVDNIYWDCIVERIKSQCLGCILTTCKPKRQIIGGRQHISFGNVASPPNYLDYVTQKKFSGTRNMCRKLLKL